MTETSAGSVVNSPLSLSSIGLLNSTTLLNLQQLLCNLVVKVGPLLLMYVLFSFDPFSCVVWPKVANRSLR